MRYVLTDEQNFINLAGSIRKLSDSAAPLFPAEMATSIDEFEGALTEAVEAQAQVSQTLQEQVVFLNQVVGGYTGEFDGGGSAEATKPIRFYSPYGDLIISYTLAEAQALTVLPPAPVLSNLTFQGWNYTLEQVQAAVGQLNIGAIYETTSGKTEIDITLTKPTGKTVSIVNVANAASIDYGDGTVNNVISDLTANISVPIVVKAPTISEEPYQAANSGYKLNLIEGRVYKVTVLDPSGETVVKNLTARIDSEPLGFQTGQVILGSILDTEEAFIVKGLAIDGVTELSESLIIIDETKGEQGFTPSFNHSYTDNFTALIYSAPADPTFSDVVIISIEQVLENPFEHEYTDYGKYTVSISGEGVSLGESIFGQAVESENYFATAVRIAGTAELGNSFSNCLSLKTIVIPNRALSVANNGFSSCKSLKGIIIPSTVTTLGIGALKGCNSLSIISMPETIQTISESLLEGCARIEKLSIPASVTQINQNAFKDCDGVEEYDLSNIAAIPTLEDINAFSGTSKISTIVVKEELLATWTAADKWLTYADYIVAKTIV